MRCEWCGKPESTELGAVTKQGRLAEHEGCRQNRMAKARQAAAQLAGKIGPEWQPVKKWQADLLTKYPQDGIEVEGARARRTGPCHNAAP